MEAGAGGLDLPDCHPLPGLLFVVAPGPGCPRPPMLGVPSLPRPPPPFLGASSAAASAKENSSSIPGITVPHTVLGARDAVIVTGG